jgi:hypothetical protein
MSSLTTRRNIKYKLKAGIIALALLSLGIIGIKFTEKSSALTTNPVTFSFGTAGDHGTGSNTIAVLKAIGAAGTDFFISTGDLSYQTPSTYSEARWCQFVKDNLNIGANKPVGDPYGETYPFQIISGNHEEGNPNEPHGLIDTFVSPGCLPDRMNSVQSPNLGTNPSPTGNYAKEYYFDYPASSPLARFIMVDPQMTFLHGGFFDFSVGSPRYNWLSTTIDQARANGIKWVIVGNHANYISAGIKTDEIGSPYFNLLLAKKVDVIIQGHEHGYQRSKQLAQSAGCPSLNASASTSTACIADGDTDNIYTKGLGPILVMTGTGGIGHYNTSTSDPQAGYFAKIMGNTTGATGDLTYGFSKFSVSESAITGSFVRASGGNYSDNFTIRAANTNDTTAPSIPTNLAATAVSGSQVNLTWTASTDESGISGYQIYRNGTQLTANAPSTSFSDNTTTPNTTYTYTVRAVDTAGNVSTDSNAASVTTPQTSPPPSTLTIGAAEDATIKKLTPTSNFGTATNVEADADPVMEYLMKFNVTGIGSQPVNSAKLRLYVTNGSSQGGSFKQVTNNSWTEQAVTWNTAPAALATTVATAGTATQNTWKEIDVTSLIKADGTYSLRVNNTSTDGVAYNSKESATNKPELIISVGTGTPTPPPPPAPDPTTLRLAPSADATIKPDFSTTNFGTATTLEIDNSPVLNSLIKFNVTGVNGRKVTSAKLRLFVTNPSNIGGIFKRVSDTSWSESAVTWNNAPAQDTSTIASLASTTTNTWAELDITSLITGDGVYSIRGSSTSSDGAAYNSKESATNKPELVLTVQ